MLEENTCIFTITEYHRKHKLQIKRVKNINTEKKNKLLLFSDETIICLDNRE